MQNPNCNKMDSTDQVSPVARKTIRRRLKPGETIKVHLSSTESDLVLIGDTTTKYEVYGYRQSQIEGALKSSDFRRLDFRNEYVFTPESTGKATIRFEVIKGNPENRGMDYFADAIVEVTIGKPSSEREDVSDAYLNHMKAEDASVKYPFLLRIYESEKVAFDKLAKKLQKNKSLEISSNIGDVYACRATWKAIQQLDQSSAVRCIEGSRPGSWE